MEGEKNIYIASDVPITKSVFLLFFIGIRAITYIKKKIMYYCFNKSASVLKNTANGR